MHPDHELLDHELGFVYDPALPLSRTEHGIVDRALALRDNFEATHIVHKAAYDKAREDWKAIRADWSDMPSMARPGARVAFDAPPVKQPRFIWSRQQLEATASMLRAFPRMFLLELVADFDTFTADVMRAMHKLEPQLLMSGEKSLNWRDIAQLDDSKQISEQIRALLVERDIIEVLRASHQDQLGLVTARAGIKQPPTLDELAEYIEVTERRNVFAHGGGRVSAHYLKTCGRLVPAGVRPGDFITIDSAWFARACEVIVIVAVALNQTVWRAVGGADAVVDADRDLAQLTYSLIVREELPLANRLLRMALDLGHHVREPFRLLFSINYAQTFKWMGDDAACRAELAKTEWTSKDVAFQLSAAVLTDNFDDAESLMRIAAAGTMRKSAFDFWPVFREFRTTEQFMRAYRHAFGGDPAQPIA